jgi:hypothetical protein
MKIKDLIKQLSIYDENLDVSILVEWKWHQLNYIEEWVVEETQEPVHIMLCDEEITDEYFEKHNSTS